MGGGGISVIIPHHGNVGGLFSLVPPVACGGRGEGGEIGGAGP